MAYASLQMQDISSWVAFHEASRVAFGFPDFYGHNSNAWIDCLSYLEEDNGMSAFVLAADEFMDVRLVDFGEFSKKYPEIALGIIQLVGFVNTRYAERGAIPRLRLVLS